MVFQLVMMSDMARAALPVSSVINTYCRGYDGLESSDEVTQIVRQLESELRRDCTSESNEQTSRMLTALRALGNAGLAASQSTSTLDRCARNNDIPTALRVAAINAFRRFQCTYSIVRLFILRSIQLLTASVHSVLCLIVTDFYRTSPCCRELLI